MMYAFAVRHPVVVAVGGLLALGMLPLYWPIFVAAVLFAGVGFGTFVLIRHALQQRELHRWQLRALVQRADYEHHLWMNGDPRGFYGGYPPRSHSLSSP